MQHTIFHFIADTNIVLTNFTLFINRFMALTQGRDGLI